MLSTIKFPYVLSAPKHSKTSPIDVQEENNKTVCARSLSSSARRLSSSSMFSFLLCLRDCDGM